VRPILPWLGGAARVVPAAINPDHHGQACSRLGIGRRPDVQVQAVLAGARVAKDHVGIQVCLHAAMAEVCGIAYAGPLRRRLRRLPAQRSHGRGGVRDAEKRPGLTRCWALLVRLQLARDRARRCTHHERWRSCGRRCPGRGKSCHRDRRHQCNREQGRTDGHHRAPVYSLDFPPCAGREKTFACTYTEV
jgi:hypothetical protein